MGAEIARPQLKAGLRRLWRDRETLQLGLDPARAVVITGLDPSATRFLDALDGTADVGSLLERAGAHGPGRTTARGLLDLLAGAGVLDDASTDRTPLRELTATERDRLGPDLAAAALVHDDTTAGARLLARRRAATVRVVGAGRIGAPLAGLLAASGLGRLEVTDEAAALPGDLSPAGLSPSQLGSHRGAAAAARARAIAPSVGATSDPAGPADLVVLTGEAHRDLAAAQLVREGVPHLYVEARETSGVVGPLVLPGRSACARCLALHRTDRDPAWAAVAAQLATPGAADSACEVVLATALAATAAAQVLCHLDGVEPPTVDGTIEIRLPDLRSRRRSWHVHPLCGCCWPPS